MIVSFYAVISLNVYFPFRLGGDGIMMFFFVSNIRIDTRMCC